MNLTPKSIIDRHDKFPDATEQLIDAYAFQEYRKAIDDLFKLGRVVKVESTDVTMIIISDENFRQWKELEMSHWYLNKKI
jgi:hypothetical protein